MTDTAPVIESKFSVVKTVDSGPPPVYSKAKKYLMKKAAAEAAKETQSTTVTPAAVADNNVQSSTLSADATPQPGTESTTQPQEKPAETPKEESTKVEEPAKELPKEEPAPLKAQFATIAKAERRIRDERKALEEERARFEAEAREIRELKAIAERDKYALLEKLNVNVEDWALKTLGKEKPKSAELSELEVVKAEVKALKDQLTQTSQAAQNETIVRNALVEIEQVLDSDTDRYAFTKAKGGSLAVLETVKHHWSQTGEVMPYADAADLVEQYYQEEADSFLGVDKFKKKLAPQGEAKATKHTQGDDEAKTKSPKENTVPDRVPTPRLSRDQRLKRAAAILSGKAP